MPSQLGDYRLLREIGHGGMGVVYEAVQESLGRHVALKVLPFHSLLNATQLGRFQREARAAARLHHTNIVPVFGVGEDLRRFLADRPIHARRTPWHERTWRWCRRNPVVAALSALLLLVLTVTAVGGVVMSLRLGEALGQAQADRDKAQDTERARRVQLVQAYQDQARAGRMSRRMGQRFESLEAIRKAAALAHELALPPARLDALRNEAIAALAQPDVRLARVWESVMPSSDRVTIDLRFQPYARIDRQGIVSVRRVADDLEIYRWTPFGSDVDPYPFLSPDGQYLGVYGFRGGELKICRLAEVEPVTVLSVLKHVTSFSVHLDCQQLAVATRDGVLTRYDLATGQPVQHLKLAAAAQTVAFHPTATREVALASGSTDYLLDLESGKQRGQKMGHPASISSLTWHPQGDLLAVAANDSKIYLWNPETCQKTVVLEGLKNGGLGTTFNRAGDLLVSSGWERTLRFWHPRSGKQLFNTPGWMMGPCPSPDDRQIVATIAGPSGRWQLGVWDVAAVPEYRTLVPDPVPGRPPDLEGGSIHPNGRWLAVAGSGGPRLRDLASGRQLVWLPIGQTNCVWFEPSGALLTSTGRGLWRWPVGNATANDAPPRIGPAQLLPVPTIGAHISESRDGRVLAVALGGGALVIHADRPQSWVRLGPHKIIIFTAVSPDGQWVATSAHGGFGVKVWEAACGKLVKELARELPSLRVRFSPDGRWLATAWMECRLWSVGSWQQTLHLPSGELPASTPDGKLMAVEVARGVLALVDPGTGREYARPEDPNQDRSKWCGFTPDGTRLVTSSESDNGYAIHVWDLPRIRRQLTELGLDWDQPSYPPAPADAFAARTGPRKMEVVGLELATKGDARDPLTLNNQAWRLVTGPVGQRDPARALSLIQEAVQVQPNNATFLNTLGVVQYRKGHYAEAVATLEKSLASGAGNDAFDLFFLAMCHAKRGEPTKAADCYDRAMKWWQGQTNLSANHTAELKAFQPEAEALLRQVGSNGKAHP